MKRRTFLKIGIGASLTLAVPTVIAKEKMIPASYNGKEFLVEIDGKEIKPVQKFTIVAKDKFSEPMLETWSNLVGIRRAPAETDEHLRGRILSKIKREN